ncbi:sugar ABC transporter substrate-binding protein [Kaistia algarum]|uniref:substrate-binding domain-containing protein n=1 Tax=Kaistia algarum TaxID=2083279 RepID=UPI000CE89619|nr:substrate-binding domain-containing protein [Kaistia algarum]MCX5512757.1 substrate-binding domain-containing protein [Kaistia algarum]PPE81743.1 sugar ABC transporter substrate-binding protein [Kaistia algarum]
MSFAGLGPHGERATPADRIALTEEDAAAARAGRFNLAVVLHTTTSDWSRQELAGIVTALGSHGAAVVEVADCGFDSDQQNRELRRLAATNVDAVISIPIGNAVVAQAHRAVAHAGKKLILLDNAPTGLIPGADYAGVVSCDNFGLGAIAAELLSPYLPEEGVAGILTYGVDFFATKEREIAFRKWIDQNRPDVTLVRAKFQTIEETGPAFDRLLAENDDLDGIFVAWDVPAVKTVGAIRGRRRSLPITTVDLGQEVAQHLAAGGPVKGVAAQRPYEQGMAAGNAALLALIGRQLPSWIVLPGFPVTKANVVEAYQVVWHAPAPAGLLRARRDP